MKHDLRSPYSPSPKGDATRSLLPRRGTGILRQALRSAQSHFVLLNSDRSRSDFSSLCSAARRK
ncbi:MAG: hypothetical protein KME32_33220 [Mojavia pulchra JT2-VF2]|uniref:Uncharacterized protein n=1 Tax=Mojavia pulchra JT2-VF2 TaxID=287848 RepID=A0A951UKB1_9NOST|nr:hypothetical protein [Mojavia pulchra JT2-VF2]